jgi:ketosteroid isomerase-like protein
LPRAERIVALLEEVVRERSVVLIGGQAVAIWTTYVQSRLMSGPVPAQAHVVSGDIDFLGNADDAQRAATMLGGRARLAKWEDRTTLAGAALVQAAIAELRARSAGTIHNLVCIEDDEAQAFWQAGFRARHGLPVALREELSEMTTMSNSQEVELLHRTWEAMSGGDFAVLEDTLAADAQWLGVEDGQLCGNRKAILEVMRRNLPGRLQGRIEETIQDGPRVIVAFRPKQPAQVDRSLDEGVAYMVVTISNGKITELKGCADRAAATTYAQTGETPDAPPITSGVQPPDAVFEPPERRVNRLVPFVRVTEVERSVGFYHHLGFTVKSVFKYRDRLSWAALESDGAEVMFEGTSEPIDRERQGVLFYLYSDDLAALRDQLLAAGIKAGEIEDGSPDPSQEMCLTDPDGYVLMVAQIE